MPVVGRALRWYAARYPDGSVVTIRTGLAGGYRWRRYRRYVNGYWIGQYELDIQHALQRELRPGDTFFDVGANAGFFTLVAARLVGPGGRCVAFDPAPENVASIREQIELNGLGHCTAMEQAVGAAAGRATFSFGTPGDSTGHLGETLSGEASTTVEVTTLDEAARRHGRPAFVKVDVEGAEVEVLRGAVDVLNTARPRWLIELHGDGQAAEVRTVMDRAGYALFTLDGTALPPTAARPKHVIARPA
jgi:FkbM family methyltransferase